MNPSHLGAAKLFPTTEPAFYYPPSLRPTRPETPQPSLLSFRSRSISTTGSSLNDTLAVEQDATSFYELLGIPDNTVSIMEIKQAYKQLARKYHPDVSPPDRVEEYTYKFIRVQEAYETLSDPRRRELYDRDIKTGFGLKFGSQRRGRFNKETGDNREWKNRWQSQVSDLKKRSTYKESTDSMSWAARIRMERNESSSPSSSS